MHFLKKKRAKDSFLRKIWFDWGSFLAYIQEYTRADLSGVKTGSLRALDGRKVCVRGTMFIQWFGERV